MLAVRSYVMTKHIRDRLLNNRKLTHIPSLEKYANHHKSHHRAGPYSRNWNSYRYRQAELGEINCRTCGVDLKAGVPVVARTGYKGKVVLRCKGCDVKVFGNGS